MNGTDVFVADLLSSLAVHAGPGMPGESVEICDRFSHKIVQAVRVFGQRQRAYGMGNVQLIGADGVLRRAEEKMARVRNLQATGGAGGGEGVRDSLIDIANLSLIALLVLEGEWSGAAWAGTQRSETDVLRDRVADLEAQLAAVRSTPECAAVEYEPDLPKRHAPPAMRPIKCRE